MKPLLAIIIPAYKANYLSRTLDSIANQTIRDFTLYIGDDNSPNNIKSIVDKYSSKINIVYHRFTDNLGGKDLVAQWDRCVKLSTTEELIWFFSDDDIMPIDGVERVLSAVKEKGLSNRFLRFPLAIIDQNDNIIDSNRIQPKIISNFQFMLDKLEGSIKSAACEHVFSRDIYNRSCGFVSFPMAWCSDDATWIKFSHNTGVETLPGNPVCWRNAEDVNISNSSNYNSQKIDATSQFIEWLHSYFGVQLKNKEFYRALRKYLRIILKVSLRREYTNHQLLTLCKSIAKINTAFAIYIYLKNFR